MVFILEKSKILESQTSKMKNRYLYPAYELSLEKQLLLTCIAQLAAKELVPNALPASPNFSSNS